MSTLRWAPRRAQLWRTQISLPLVAHLMAPPGCSGTLCKAPGGARDLAATQGALQPARLAQAGGG